MIVATRNRYKFSEIKLFLEPHPSFSKLTSLLDYPNLPDIDEDCLSFAGNALKKAKTISKITGEAVLADDSGLVVHALDGRPGVFSARYAGHEATDDQNNQKLLLELKNIPTDKRQAMFVCAIVMHFPNGRFFTSIGELNGMMIDERKGKHGFGYDPIFFMPDKNQTLAEVPETQKIQFSHRTKALENLLKILDRDLFCLTES